MDASTSSNSRKAIRSSRRPAKRRPVSIKKLVRQEMLKASETKITLANGTEVSLPVSTAYTMVDFPLAISQGTSHAERIGNRVTLTALGLNEVLWNPSADVAEGVSIRRIILKVDGGVYQTNTEIANDLFEGSTTDGAPGTTTLDLVRKVNRQSMHVLKDDVIQLNAAASGHSQYAGKWFQKFDQVLDFQETTTAQPVNWRYVAIYMARQTANDGAIFSCELSYQMQAYFKDL